MPRPTFDKFCNDVAVGRIKETVEVADNMFVIQTRHDEKFAIKNSQKFAVFLVFVVKNFYSDCFSAAKIQSAKNAPKTANTDLFKDAVIANLLWNRIDGLIRHGPSGKIIRYMSDIGGIRAALKKAISVFGKKSSFQEGE